MVDQQMGARSVYEGLYEIRVDGTTKNTLEYEIVQVVDTGPILRDMAFSMDHEHLYIMSEKQVAAFQAVANAETISLYLS
ncbi:plexin-a4 isoform x1 [Limosa lapponica baueri]|uniref:Plexin-a4 isoform x1 n=1 Tax=Limosa lapponica baueri TaxID=1758121 RepID=A0A2I0T9H5_LIMLA|nr:plexin-a4 isoform x1 [Limosa lapponica baueri]